MTPQNGYVWITSQWPAVSERHVTRSEHFAGAICSLSQFSEMFYATIEIRRKFTVDSGQNTADTWWKQLKQELENRKRGNRNDENYQTLYTAGFLHDSLWAIARTLEKIEKNQPNVFAYIDRENLFSNVFGKELRDLKMRDGLTGAIDFQAKNGSRKTDFDLYQHQQNYTDAYFDLLWNVFCK